MGRAQFPRSMSALKKKLILQSTVSFITHFQPLWWLILVRIVQLRFSLLYSIDAAPEETSAIFKGKNNV